jgi:hypothetical protein
MAVAGTPIIHRLLRAQFAHALTRADAFPTPSP